MSSEDRTYPRSVSCEGIQVELRPMTSADQEAVLAFARRLPAHDLLFMRRDITQPKVVAAWVKEAESGPIKTVLALQGGEVIGCAALIRDELSWSPHVGELRAVVSPAMKGKGLGRVLMQESFAIALGLGLSKIVAFMTVDQRGAIAVFESLGFRAEGLLRDHVKDREGKTHDLVILSHDVANVQSQLEAFGLTEAF